MKAVVEVYKGIEFVRLSSLVQDQAEAILQSGFSRKIIKILRENELITDCLPYTIYLEWYHQSFAMQDRLPEAVFQNLGELKLALKQV